MLEYGTIVTPRMSGTSVEVGHNPQAQGLKRNRHNFDEGRKLEEAMIPSADISLGGYENPRVVKNDRCFIQLAESMELSELSSSTREILQCL